MEFRELKIKHFGHAFIFSMKANKDWAFFGKFTEQDFAWIIFPDFPNIPKLN
jgi:hypothetical protein